MNNLVQAARAYIGTRWRHLGRTKRGLDCAGLVLRAYEDCGVHIQAPSRYGRDPFADGLMSAITDAAGDPVWQGIKSSCRTSVLRPGDVVVMAPASKPRHMALIGDDSMYGLSLIHADGTPGVGKVVEHGLSDFYRNMIVAVFRRPVA